MAWSSCSTTDCSTLFYYFIGDKAVGFGGKHYGGSPKELFTYLPFSGNFLGVQFTTKYGTAYEEDISMAITPPLALWMGKSDIYRLCLEQKRHGKLLALLLNDPNHSIITSCLYYFYAQSGELFNNNLYLDTMFLCGALEAAFGISGKQKRKEVLIEHLMKEYCPPECTVQNRQRYKQFFDGFYDFRSIGAHGIRVSEIALTAQDMAAYKNFNKLKGRFSITRAIARDVILRSISRLPGDDCDDSFYDDDDDASDLLKASIQADDIWKRILHYANRPQSIRSLANPTQAYYEEFVEQTRDFCDIFRIELLDSIPDRTEIIKYYSVFVRALFRRATGLDNKISILQEDVDLENRENIRNHLSKIDRYSSDALIRQLYEIVEKFMKILDSYVFLKRT